MATKKNLKASRSTLFGSVYHTKVVDEPLRIGGSAGNDWKISIIECSHELSVISYSELHEFILAGFVDGTIRVFKDNKCVMQFLDEDIRDNPAAVTGLKHRPVTANYPISNSLIATFDNGYIKSWNYNFQECTWTLFEKREISGLSFHPRLAKFVTLGDKKIFIYDEDSKRQERVLAASDNKGSSDGHKGMIMSCCFNPRQGNELISGGLDNTIQFWDVRQPNAVRFIEGVMVKGDGISFNSKGTEFITCSLDADKPFRLWDYKSGKEIKTLEPDPFRAKLMCGRYMTRQHVVCAGLEPNLARVVDLETAKSVISISNCGHPITSLSIGPTDGNRVTRFVCCGGDKIYEITPK